MNPKVDEFINNASKWQKELSKLREIVLECGLEEEVKWNVPCYTYKDANIVIIHGFKEYCALNFFNGALLKDEDAMLTRQTENVQAGRQMRFTNLSEIVEKEPIIKAYLFEAIEVEKAGLKVEMKKVSDFDVPEELTNIFEKDEKFKAAFEALTPGRQKGYLLHFAGAKQAATREARITKYRQRIFDGFGMYDCVCGLSKRMPRCDGSHKDLSW